VSRTVADLKQSAKINKEHINTAVDLMGLNDNYFRDF
jgi:predicted ATPase with chaperone activity